VTKKRRIKPSKKEWNARRIPVRRIDRCVVFARELLSGGYESSIRRPIRRKKRARLSANVYRARGEIASEEIVSIGYRKGDESRMSIECLRESLLIDGIDLLRCCVFGQIEIDTDDFSRRVVGASRQRSKY